jgi:hypothetical protein
MRVSLLLAFHFAEEMMETVRSDARSHTMPLAGAPTGDEMFVNKVDHCEKIVLKV